MITLIRENVDNLEGAINSEFGFNNVVGVIRDNNNIVGFYNVWIDEPEIKLQELEIIEKYQNQGYGTSFLKALFDKYPDCTEITGQSLESSVSFYQNFNAEFSTTCDNCCVNCFSSKSSMEDNDNDLCDEYSDLMFKIERNEFFQQIKGV